MSITTEVKGAKRKWETHLFSRSNNEPGSVKKSMMKRLASLSRLALCLKANKAETARSAIWLVHHLGIRDSKAALLDIIVQLFVSELGREAFDEQARPAAQTGESKRNEGALSGNRTHIVAEEQRDGRAAPFFCVA